MTQPNNDPAQPPARPAAAPNEPTNEPTAPNDPQQPEPALPPLITTYDPEFLSHSIVSGVCSGLDLSAIAEAARWCPAAIHRWAGEQPDLASALIFARKASADVFWRRAGEVAARPRKGPDEDRLNRSEAEHHRKTARALNPETYMATKDRSREKAPDDADASQAPAAGAVLDALEDASDGDGAYGVDGQLRAASSGDDVTRSDEADAGTAPGAEQPAPARAPNRWKADDRNTDQQ